MARALATSSLVFAFFLGCGTPAEPSSSAGGAAPAALPDPAAPGPYAFTEIDDKPTLAGSAQLVHCAHPTSGPTKGPYPLVLLEHGFLGTNGMMSAYVERLASFGYVACAVDYPSGFSGSDNSAQLAILKASLDWALAESASPNGKLAGLVDPARIGATGHSLGGKLALLLAQRDSRVRAAILLDPVDGGGPMGCKEPACFDASAAMGGLAIPTGFLGETIDAASSGIQSCAPKDQNFETFYAGAPSPSFSVDVVGANHVSFIGATAPGFCNPATAETDAVMELATAYVAAFYERHLRGIEAYEDYLTGEVAKRRYVGAGRATLAVK